MTGPNSPLVGAVEFGGTKVVAAVGTDPFQPAREIRIATEDAPATLARLNDFLVRTQAELGPIMALGVGAFGPIQLRRNATDFGVVGRTTKPGWEGSNLPQRLTESVACPILLDTDVNAAALAEAHWGAGRDAASFAYVTVGTGIGGGIIVNGAAITGMLHPEIGHIRIVKHPSDTYRGRCPYHEDCIEALASGPAIFDRFGRTLSELAIDHPFHEIFADYLSQLCSTLVLAVSPDLIVIGGGVMGDDSIHRNVERKTRTYINGYVKSGAPGGAFVVPSALHGRAGILGGFAMAQNEVAKRA